MPFPLHHNHEIYTRFVHVFEIGIAEVFPVNNRCEISIPIPQDLINGIRKQRCICNTKVNPSVKIIFFIKHVEIFYYELIWNAFI